MAYEYTTQGYTVNDSGRRLVVDPVTRIEGHLRCEVNINDDNVITNAVSCGTMFRGLEIIVKDRDPRDIWAFVERICGVCTGTHALASVHAIEDALKIDIPDNANIIRNLMQLALWYHDHLVHFYQLGMMTCINLLIILILTGFGMYVQSSDSVILQPFHLVVDFIYWIGDSGRDLHSYHRLGMLFLMCFIIIHLYMVIREEIMGKSTLVSTMFSGFRLLRSGKGG